MATMFDTESEAQAFATELNAGGDQDVRYQAERYRDGWAIARRSKHTYWLWESYPDLVAPKPVEKDDVDTVRRIVNLALGDGMEILILMALLRSAE